jgi:uncharacterized protein YjiK
MENNHNHLLFLFFCSLLAVVSCESQKPAYASPPGYSFNAPTRYNMPFVLNEISGIAFNRGMSDTLYTEEDEDGIVFHFAPGDNHILKTRFWKKGDFEDISITNNSVVMLRSDGTLYTFPLSETQHSETSRVKVFENLLPAGEYEGLASDETGTSLFVLCKHCTDEKTNKWGGGSILRIDGSGVLVPAGSFAIQIKDIDALDDSGKINFHPSALALNPFTQEWFILSSVNKILVIADRNWKIKSVYPLNPAMFNQPEGIAFDNKQNLYISNERGQTTAASILVFAYQGLKSVR